MQPVKVSDARGVGVVWLPNSNRERERGGLTHGWTRMSASGRPASKHSRHRRLAFFFSCELENAATGLGLWHAPHTLVGPAAAAVAPGCVTGLAPTDIPRHVVRADDAPGGAAARGGGVQYFLWPPSFQCSRW